MKRNLILLIAILITAGAAFADGMVFDPTEYSESSGISIAKISAASATSTSSTSAESTKSSASEAHKTLEKNIQDQSTLAQDAISGQSTSFNNALYELDSAQVNIRNELLDYQSQYQEVDTQYKLVKEQRKVLASQIRSVERKIKSIERSKNHIRKTMI